ncbi:Thermolysin metallopeptidase, catalytic domain [Microlunatus sagamiharensis]|uniref:Neutral metalloproteinase n=1 Tax=Microlunatus sagamiharensis TaxID=546874 RepID=A0A1H2MZ24_9ACTN|nr:protealysin inhibitor emfourin [Microlunatus sagamiharensis]SDU98509.1 Thermolysin metallopeptidase, catalytic domain [Microlunatus sagamiharensis]
MTPTADADRRSPQAIRCSFVPPYLLRRLAESDPGRRLLADGRDTLAVDERMRSRREAATATTAPAVPDTGGNRVVYDAGGAEELPGRRARDEDDPATGDAAVDEAHAHSGVSWDLFAEVFDRPSVDGRGTPLTVTVHYGRDYDNAFWDGEQLVFGDGDGEVFDRFTKPLDVTAHEFTHGVTQFSAGLTYQGQSGALNESVSDVFASLAKQRSLGQDASQADWLIGQGLFMPDVKATALRSMLEPGTAYDDPRLGRDPQVGSMDDYVDTEEDNGGVHLNSGIPNRAFALAARAIGGPSWEKAGQVWYAALTGGAVTPSTDFEGFAAATVDAAARLYPEDTSVADHVREAWQQVGLARGTQAVAAQTPPSGGPAPAGPGGGSPSAKPQAPAGAPDPVGSAGVPSLPGQPGDDVVAVRRSGGFTGASQFAQLSLTDDPAGTELRRLLDQISVSDLGRSEPQPDRFTYTVACRSFELTVPEQDLTPELTRVVQIVLDQRAR